MAEEKSNGNASTVWKFVAGTSVIIAIFAVIGSWFSSFVQGQFFLQSDGRVLQTRVDTLQQFMRDMGDTLHTTQLQADRTANTVLQGVQAIEKVQAQSDQNARDIIELKAKAPK